MLTLSSFCLSLSVVLLFSSQSLAETPPELPNLLLLLRPLQVGGGAHEFVQLAEAFGDVVLGQRFQEDQDHLSASIPIEEPEVGEVQLVAAPVGLDEILREDEDGSPAAFHGAHYVVQNPVPGKEVPLVEAQSQRPVIHRLFIIVPEEV